MTTIRPTAIRVLIVEDSRDARDMYVMFLQIAGLQVQAAADVETALQLALDWQPDVIVTDFLLAHGLNGAELCRQIHDDPRTSHIRMLVMTGSSRREDVEAILGAGCAEVRQKPYLPDALLEDVRRLAASASAARKSA